MFYKLHFLRSDKPRLPQSDVNYFPTIRDISRMSQWMKYWISKQIVKYHSAFKTCAKYIRYTDADPKILVENLVYSPPETKFESKITVLALNLEDPSTSQGMINVSRKLVPYIPTLPSSKKQKCPVFGDQGFFEKG